MNGRRGRTHFLREMGYSAPKTPFLLPAAQVACSVKGNDNWPRPLQLSTYLHPVCSKQRLRVSLAKRCSFRKNNHPTKRNGEEELGRGVRERKGTYGSQKGAKLHLLGPTYLKNIFFLWVIVFSLLRDVRVLEIFWDMPAVFLVG